MDKKTGRRIAAVVIVAMILIAADLIVSGGNEVEVERSGKQIYLVRPAAGEDGGNVSLTAEVEGRNGIYEKKINIFLGAYENKAEEKTAAAEGREDLPVREEEQIEYGLRTIADGINDDSSEIRIGLPPELESGEKITWKVEKGSQSNTIAIIAMACIVSAAVYRERFSSVRKKEKKDRETVLRQLPGFINRLVLLLNAGLVIHNAFYAAVEESIAGREAENDYFYKNMKEIYVSMKTTNGSMNSGLKEFAGRSGSRELMRVSNIIEDNINKGTELARKLQNEGELLWMERKKRCEELGRLAETRLTLPLILFLVVLIVITIAPAMLEL